jgi:hypothetical protein
MQIHFQYIYQETYLQGKPNRSAAKLTTHIQWAYVFAVHYYIVVFSMKLRSCCGFFYCRSLLCYCATFL